MHKLFNLTKLNVYIIKMLFLLAFVCVGIFRVGILHGGNFSMGEFLCCHIYRWGCDAKTDVVLIKMITTLVVVQKVKVWELLFTFHFFPQCFLTQIVLIGSHPGDYFRLALFSFTKCYESCFV